MSLPFPNLKIVKTAPVVPSNGASNIQCLASIVTPTPPIVTDFCGTNIVPVLTSTVNNPVVLTCNGTKTYTFTYTNCAGLSSTWKYVYTINDNTAPTFTRSVDKTIYAGTNCEFNASVSVTGDVTDELDNCSSNLQATYSDVISAGLGQVVYIIHRNWSLVDNCNNAAANQVQTITVLDTTPPVIIPPQDHHFLYNKCSSFNPFVTDNCGIYSITNNAPESFTIGNTTVVIWTVTDIHGNSSTTTQNVTVSNVSTSIVSSSQVSCYNANDGVITVTANGGTGAYSYSLNGGAVQTSNIFSGLASGSYIITVFDQNNCSAITSNIVIANPALLTASAVGSVQVTCYNVSDGVITVTANGGTGAYSYSLNGGAIQSSNIFSGLVSGSYLITVSIKIIAPQLLPTLLLQIRLYFLQVL